ncbi:hypothetical protein CHARACLAT_025142 [Characodon lateralis]|uniref:Uncharacterized protein n=1 Tax=Characodon lateralis TaxID=208331 RepID=A0ABU7ED11_9TELE|nr:hypothetical protein [Characodon lateralis]
MFRRPSRCRYVEVHPGERGGIFLPPAGQGTGSDCLCLCIKQQFRLPTLFGVLGVCWRVPYWVTPLFCWGTSTLTLAMTVRSGGVWLGGMALVFLTRVVFCYWTSVFVMDCP